MGQLLEMVLAYFAAVGIEVEVIDDGVATGDGKVFGLEPLRRRLGRQAAGEWQEAVRRHFDTLMAVDPELPATYLEAVPHLRVAVVAEADLGLFQGEIMERKLVDGLGERLMFRRGPLGITVRVDVVDAWGEQPAAVWERGRRGALWDEPVERDEILLGDLPVTFSRLRGGRWTSTWVVALEEHLARPTPYGAVVAVPTREEIYFHPIRDESFADAAVAMLGMAAAALAESPLPVGCDLFWWRAGKLDRICTPGDGRYQYLRVPEFSAMLWQLEQSLRRPPSASRRLGRKAL